MKLVEKLLGYLNRVFDKGPDAALALRLRYDGSAMSWTVADGVLTTTVTGGTGAALRVDLAGFTVGTLSVFLAAQPGYTVPFVDTGELLGLSALALIDATGDQAQSNGDHLTAFRSVLWSYMTGQATELTSSRAAIGEALLQIAATTASDTWVDEHGGYYGIPRRNGEADAPYAARMVAEITSARGNGVAIAEAIRLATTGISAKVTDYATITVSGGGVGSYGLFDADVEVGVDSPLDQVQINSNTLSIIEAMRDAGTHLRKLRYIRTTTLAPYMGAYLRVGHEVSLSWSGYNLFYGPSGPSLTATWALDGSQTYSGMYQAPVTPALFITAPSFSAPTSSVSGTTFTASAAGSASIAGGGSTVAYSAAGAIQSSTYSLIADGNYAFPSSLSMDVDITSTNPYCGAISIASMPTTTGANGYVEVSFFPAFNQLTINTPNTSTTVTDASLAGAQTIRIEYSGAGIITVKRNGTTLVTLTDPAAFDVVPDIPTDPTTRCLGFIDVTGGGTDSVSRACTMTGLRLVGNFILVP